MRRSRSGTDERDLLRDEAADREAEQVHALETDRLDEGDRTVSHRLDRVRGRAARRGDSDIVERDYASLRGESVDHRRVPVVEVSAKVLQRDERNVARANVAVGVLDAVLARYAFRRHIRVLGCVRHGAPFSPQEAR